MTKLRSASPCGLSWRTSGFEVVEAPGLAAARRGLGEIRYDAVLLEAYLTDGYGVEFINEVRNVDPTVPIIMTTGHGTIPMAVEAMRRGADYFLTKPGWI